MDRYPGLQFYFIDSPVWFYANTKYTRSPEEIGSVGIMGERKSGVVGKEGTGKKNIYINKNNYTKENGFTLV